MEQQVGEKAVKLNQNTSRDRHPNCQNHWREGKILGWGRTEGHPSILPFKTGLATFTASGYWLTDPLSWVDIG